MDKQKLHRLLASQQGMVTADAYSTAWVAMVPNVNDLRRPAWPQAVDYIRTHQLPDGGWGESHIYSAHERTLSTLASICALLSWHHAEDTARVVRGVGALNRYAPDLLTEPYELVGFELLLPRLVAELQQLGIGFQLETWANTLKIGYEKLKLIGELKIDYNTPRPWWFSLELLPIDHLAEVDNRILNGLGSVETSVAATAAYLRALRFYGKDNPEMVYFLDQMVNAGMGSVGFCWPLEIFELTWMLEIYRQAGMSPHTPTIARLISRLVESWNTDPKGLAWSMDYSVNDGDDTSVGYGLMRWAGMQPNPEPFFSFWQNDHFATYNDERTASVTVNLHALSALRHDLHHDSQKQMAITVTEWLRKRWENNTALHDKWHISPIYVAAHGISAFAGWDDELARWCTNYLLEQQRPNGGWGEFHNVTLEETAHAVLGLSAAKRAGILSNNHPFTHAYNFFEKNNGHQPLERLWIGKTLFHPIGVVQTLIEAARTVLCNEVVHSSPLRYWMPS